MNFEDINFDVRNNTFNNDLDKIALYLDYALNTTIKKQMPNISIKDEKLYAIKLLCNYFKGDMHSFTSKNNIRNNIYTIGNEKLTNLFLKCMIEKHAYNILIKKINGSSEYNDQCANYITNRIARNHYSDIIEWLNNDFDNIEEIIANYINIFYQRKYEDRLELEHLTEKNNVTNQAINNLKNLVQI